MKVLSIFLYLFIYLIIYLNQYGLMDIYFTLWVILQYYFILLYKLFQTWSLGSLSAGSCVPFTYVHHCFYSVLGALLAFLALQDAPGPSSCPTPRISHLSKEPWFFLLRMLFEVCKSSFILGAHGHLIIVALFAEAAYFKMFQ